MLMENGHYPEQSWHIQGPYWAFILGTYIKRVYGEGSEGGAYWDEEWEEEKKVKLKGAEPSQDGNFFVPSLTESSLGKKNRDIAALCQRRWKGSTLLSSSVPLWGRWIRGVQRQLSEWGVFLLGKETNLRFCFKRLGENLLGVQLIDVSYLECPPMSSPPPCWPVKSPGPLWCDDIKVRGYFQRFSEKQSCLWITQN